MSPRPLFDVGQVHLVPSWLEMAERHQSTARYHLEQARQFGDTPKGRKHMADAQHYARMAAQAKLEMTRTLLLRDGLFEAARKLDAQEAARV